MAKKEREEMGKTLIDWADKVFNPITGCSHSGSPGCDNCYAKRMAQRLKGRYGYPEDDPFRVTFHSDRLNEPLHWKKPSRIFVCSMGDIAHENVSWTWFEEIMGTISDCHQHLFLLLTKRPERLKKLLGGFWPFHNFWIGVSVENQKTADERIPILLQIPAAKRFVSVEPMLGAVDLSGWLFIDEEGNSIEPPIHWIICGGETGPHARPLHPDWAMSLKDQCVAAGIPFFFKSWGTANGKRKTHILDGRQWNEIP